MRILLTGGTGLIGRALCKALLAEGHHLTVLSRRPESVAPRCGTGVEAMAGLDEWLPDRHFDAVINLAGEPIVDAAWTGRRKQVLRDSRIALTEKLVARIAAANHKPSVLLSGSAVGYYGNQGDRELDETAAAGEDFAACLCRDWEAEARMAERYGVRVCLLRTGLVLSQQGGILAKMVLPFKLALGARLGSGKQGMSWIHLDDYVAQVLRLLHTDSMRGAYNMTAPHPVSNAEFTRTLAEVLHRPAWACIPERLLRMTMGERASLLLDGQCVLPHRLLASGAVFNFDSLAKALKNLLN